MHFLEKAKAAGAELRAEGGKLYGRNLPLELRAELKGHRAELVALLNYNGNDGGDANRPSHIAPENGGVSWTESATVADYKEALEQFRKLSAFILSRHRHDQAIWAAEMFLREWGALAITLVSQD
jgi:hypothetical protein